MEKKIENGDVKLLLTVCDKQFTHLLGVGFEFKKKTLRHHH